jgi:hypothetical protein
MVAQLFRSGCIPSPHLYRYVLPTAAPSLSIADSIEGRSSTIANGINRDYNTERQGFTSHNLTPASAPRTGYLGTEHLYH